MEARVAQIESDVAKTQVGVRELRIEMKAANGSIARLKLDIARRELGLTALAVQSA